MTDDTKQKTTLPTLPSETPAGDSQAVVGKAFSFPEIPLSPTDNPVSHLRTVNLPPLIAVTNILYPVVPTWSSKVRPVNVEPIPEPDDIVEEIGIGGIVCPSSVFKGAELPDDRLKPYPETRPDYLQNIIDGGHKDGRDNFLG